MKVKLESLYKELSEELNLPQSHVEIICNFVFRFMKQDIVEKNEAKALMMPFFGKLTMRPHLIRNRENEERKARLRSEEHSNSLEELN